MTWEQHALALASVAALKSKDPYGPIYKIALQ